MCVGVGVIVRVSCVGSAFGFVIIVIVFVVVDVVAGIATVVIAVL